MMHSMLLIAEWVSFVSNGSWLLKSFYWLRERERMRQKINLSSFLGAIWCKAKHDYTVTDKRNRLQILNREMNTISFSRNVEADSVGRNLVKQGVQLENCCGYQTEWWGSDN